MIDGVSSISGYQSYYDFSVKKNSSAEEEIFSQNANPAGKSEENSTKKNFSVDQKDKLEKKDKNEAGKNLSEEQQKQVEALKKRDQEVRQHEAAHQAAAGGLARGKSFSYQKGPDGQQYAIGGEVQIDTSPGKTPQETIQRMKAIQRAALAPADPSGQDTKVAAQAAKTEAEARSQLAQEPKVQETGEKKSSGKILPGEKNSPNAKNSFNISDSQKNFTDVAEEIQKKNSEKNSSYQQISNSLQNSNRLKSVYTQNSGVAPLKCSICQGSGCYHAG